jgi:L-asparaginase II
VTLGVDGCSAPNFALPLAASARAAALWASPDRAEGVPDPARAGAARLARALAVAPEMIGGTKRLDTDLIRQTGGRVLAKMGAEGLWILGVRGEETGIALKAEDGAGRAVYPVGLAILRTLGVLSEADRTALSAYHDPLLRNHRRIAVGKLEVVPPTGV